MTVRIDDLHKMLDAYKPPAARAYPGVDEYIFPPKVLVLGASGRVGLATLSALVEFHGHRVQLFAGVRDLSKWIPMLGVKAVQMDMGLRPQLTTELKGFDRVLIVSPGDIDVTRLATDALSACKDTGVGFVAVISVAGIEEARQTMFSKQFLPIEQAVQRSGLAFTGLRFPPFLDNIFDQARSINKESSFCDVRDVDQNFHAIAASDAGRAIAAVLSEPGRHQGRIYTVIGHSINNEDLAECLSRALGRSITFSKVDDETFKAAMMERGHPEWKVVRHLEMLHASASPGTAPARSAAFEDITGSTPQPLLQWCRSCAGKFTASGIRAADFP